MKTKLACLLLAGLVGCTGNDQSTEPEAPPLRPVKVIEAAMSSASSQRTLAATVISADSQNLSFRVGGSIVELPVDVGDELAIGALVAALDKQQFLLSEKEAQASLAQASASYSNAQSQYQRTRDLYATEAASLSDLENAKANAASAAASRTLAREGVNAAQLNLEYSELRNPGSNCLVVSVPVAINQNISAGQTIVTTACGEQLRLRTTVPESLINRIDIGMPVVATTPAGAVELRGRVIEIAVTAEAAGYPVEIELNSPPAEVKPGMASQLTFTLGGQRGRMIVPLSAVLSDSEGKFVYVAEPSADHYQIARQAVDTGELSNDGIEVVEGLVDGQQVVVAGMSRVSPGMKVTLYSGVAQ